MNRILATVESKLPPSVSHALPSFDPAEGELVAAIRRISSLPPPLVPTGSLRQRPDYTAMSPRVQAGLTRHQRDAHLPIMGPAHCRQGTGRPVCR